MTKATAGARLTEKASSELPAESQACKRIAIPGALSSVLTPALVSSCLCFMIQNLRRTHKHKTLSARCALFRLRGWGKRNLGAQGGGVVGADGGGGVCPWA